MTARLSLAALLLLLPLAACSGGEAGRVEVSDLRLVRERDGTPVLSGVFINLSEQTVSSADIGITLYDEDGLPFDEPARLAVSRVAPGDSAYFRQRLDVNARRANLKYVLAN